MLIVLVTCILVATARGQDQQQSLCMKLYGFYETICLNQPEVGRSVVAQGPAGKRGIPGAKGEGGSPGVPGLAGEPGVVDYNRVKDMISEQMQGGTVTNSWPGWGKSGRRYYKCFNDNKATYQQAKTACGRYGGRLAAEVLRDPDAAKYIASHCYTSVTQHPWIGYDDIGREVDWRWVDGGVMNANTTQWWGANPDNGDDGRGEDCANIRKVTGNKLLIKDLHCMHIRTYICEI